jgi:hypothetical protein
MAYLRYYPDTYLQKLRKIAKTSVRIADVPAKIWRGNLAHTSP